MTLHRSVVVLSNSAPPSRFRIFRRGENLTEKGTFIFDEESARLVMSEQGEHQAQIMIDLEHLSLDQESRSYDPDARGWGRLAVIDGELWMVDVEWTPDGARRLREKAQKYISPTFMVDNENRITSVINVALTALPATHEPTALVAKRGIKMNPKKLIQLASRIARDHRRGVKLSIDVDTLRSVGSAVGVDSEDIGELIAGIIAWVDELKASFEPDTEGDAADEVLTEDVKDEETLSEEPEEEETLSETEEEKDLSLEEQLARSNAKLSVLLADKAKRDKAAKAARKQQEIQAKAAELVQRVELCRGVVRGGMPPALVWKDDDATTPREPFASMAMAELRKLSKTSTGAASGGPVVPTGTIRGSSQIVEISDYESKRVKVAASKSKVDYEVALAEYIEEKERHALGAKDDDGRRRLARRIEPSSVLADHSGTIKLAAVKPIESFGAASQRMLEEFRTEYMVQYSVMPRDWVGEIGSILASGSLRDTYPLDFSAVEFKERTAQSAAAEIPQVVDITVDKREYRAAKQADLRRVQSGDFAYINTWQQGAAQMARARRIHRARQVAALLNGGDSADWVGDGKKFFASDHKVHPFNPKMKMLGSTSWSNLGTAKPLSAGNLTAEKAAMLFVPHFDGGQLESMPTGMLVPTAITEAARLLLTVQDIILGTDGSVGGGIRNEHYMSGFKYIWGPQLAGTDSTANYYLFAEDTIAMGFVPWVVSEDAEEEILEWSTDSDFYRENGNIKIEYKIYSSAALVWPHGIRKVKGA